LLIVFFDVLFVASDLLLIFFLAILKNLVENTVLKVLGWLELLLCLLLLLEVLFAFDECILDFIISKFSCLVYLTGLVDSLFTKDVVKALES